MIIRPAAQGPEIFAFFRLDGQIIDAGMAHSHEAVARKFPKDAGIEVIENVLQKECEELNKRFITYNTKKHPYVILKWAQTMDGFIAPDATK